ncbi:Hypothetical protein PFR_JS8_1974 [Propionibacterium freudenreichii]|nr:S-layer homology domain-containing protein [Propionibacterium freudenreichii]CEI31450.1 S-layer protein [Propionibacterium freudenreichii]SBN53369.1 Hypothetical protein PFR_JS8_1974 [Propionibacterium freudenreichii]
MSRIQLPRLSRIAIAAAASAALIGTSFIAPATAFAAPNTPTAVAAAATNGTAASNDAAAEAASLVINDPTYHQGAYTDPHSNNQIELYNQVAAYTNAEGTGTPALTTPVGTQHISPKNMGQSIVNADQTKSMYQVMTIKNTSTADFTVNEQMLLPRFYLAYSNDSKSVAVDPSGFDNGVLKSELVTNPIKNQSITYSYKDADDTYPGTPTPSNLEKVILQGQLAPGASVTVRVPLALPTLPDAATGLVFSIGESAVSIGGQPETSVRFASPLKAGDTSLVPYTGAFLATVKSKDGSKYTTVPSLQRYMPTAENGVNYWVNNFRAAAASGASDGLLYLNGYYTVPTAPLAAAVKEHGYDTAFSNGNRMTQYSYQASTTSANVVDSDGNPVKVNPDRTAPYVELRQVIDGHDTEAAVGGKFDPVGGLGLVVNDHDGNPITLPSDDVTIDISKVNTAANGTYPVTVTYTPDGVSNTFNVKVGTGTSGGGGGTTTTVTPKAPTQGANQVTIPTVPGVDYLINGRIVTGTLNLDNGQTITVTAQAQKGYTLAAGATTSWAFTYNKGTTPTCNTQYFTDVTPGMQFFNDICWLKANNITTGWPDGTYRPVTPINRDAMIAYIYRMAGSPAFTPTTQTFSDVAPNNQFFTEIEWAASRGITTGWPDGTFRPVTPVARDAMAAFLYRQSGSPAVALPANPSFNDVAAGNMYYKEIQWMQNQGIANGWADGTYRPLNDTNRDAMAAFIHRAVTNGVLTLK